MLRHFATSELVVRCLVHLVETSHICCKIVRNFIDCNHSPCPGWSCICSKLTVYLDHLAVYLDHLAVYYVYLAVYYVHLVWQPPTPLLTTPVAQPKTSQCLPFAPLVNLFWFAVKLPWQLLLKVFTFRNWKLYRSRDPHSREDIYCARYKYVLFYSLIGT